MSPSKQLFNVSSSDLTVANWIELMNDEINGARDVTKTNTDRVETFRAPELGFLGYVDTDKVSFYRASTRRHTTQSEFDVRSVKELPKVDILYSYVEANTSIFQALVASGTQGTSSPAQAAGPCRAPSELR